MATVFSHAIAGAAIVAMAPRRTRTLLVSICGAVTAMLPDLDYIGFVAKVPYDSLWGHRGVTHSILFAIGIGALAAFLVNKKSGQAISGLRILFFLTTFSHACLDACTNGGLGVAFYSPYNLVRFFFPWRPIQVSPMGLGFFSERGLVVLISEFYWIVLPCAFIFALRVWLNRFDRKDRVR